MQNLIELIVYGLIGLAALGYAINSNNIKFCRAEHLPEPFNKRKVIFLIGFVIVIVGFLSAYLIGVHHNIITLIGGWFMLLGSTRWFQRRDVRIFFVRDEWRVIRQTIFAGLIIMVLSIGVSTGFFVIQSHLSIGTFFVGLAIAYLGGRLWWNQDEAATHQVMVQSKRDYS